MSKLLFLIILLFPIRLFALEIKCDFEEVYPDGKTQQGFFLVKDQKLRYEYHNENLFTIFSKNDDFFIVNKNNTKNFQKVQTDTSYIKELLIIASLYPDINNYYEKESLIINLEPSSNGFYKRVSILSENLKISIFLNNCKFISFHNRFYNYSPYFEFIE